MLYLHFTILASSSRVTHNVQRKRFQMSIYKSTLPAQSTKENSTYPRLLSGVPD